MAVPEKREAKFRIAPWFYPTQEELWDQITLLCGITPSASSSEDQGKNQGETTLEDTAAFLCHDLPDALTEKEMHAIQSAWDTLSAHISQEVRRRERWDRRQLTDLASRVTWKEPTAVAENLRAQSEIGIGRLVLLCDQRNARITGKK